MTEIYRKRGSVVRWENGWTVRVTEAGEAVDDGASFVARPVEVPRFLSSSEFLGIQREELRGTQELRGTAERLILTEGFAEHECNGIRWSDHTRRMHVALTHGTRRALLDLAEFDFALVERVAQALAKDGGVSDPERVRLAPHVTASLLPMLIGSIAIDQAPGLHDGRGNAIVEMPVDGKAPNVWRPSYRLRPVPAWHNLRARPFGVIDRDAIEAIAIVGGQLLLEDGSLCDFDLHQVAGAGEPRGWYPIHAGALGAEMALESRRRWAASGRSSSSRGRS